MGAQSDREIRGVRCKDGHWWLDAAYLRLSNRFLTAHAPRRAFIRYFRTRAEQSRQAEEGGLEEAR